MNNTLIIWLSKKFIDIQPSHPGIVLIIFCQPKLAFQMSSIEEKYFISLMLLSLNIIFQT